MSEAPRRPRQRLIRFGLIVVVSLLGIASRRFGGYLPALVAAYAGDTLWALAVFLGIGLLMPGARTRTVAALAMAFSAAVEVSQLYHAPWLDAIRQTTLGALVLGSGFARSDLACYAVGVGLGVGIEWAGRAPRVPETRIGRTDRAD